MIDSFKNEIMGKSKAVWKYLALWRRLMIKKFTVLIVSYVS